MSCTSMTTPRMILPERFYMVTRRCSQRQFLLRPDPDCNQVFLYCLIEAAIRWDITVLLPSVLSNHHLCAAAHKWCYVQQMVMRSWQGRAAILLEMFESDCA